MTEPPKPKLLRPEGSKAHDHQPEANNGLVVLANAAGEPQSRGVALNR